MEKTLEQTRASPAADVLAASASARSPAPQAPPHLTPLDENNLGNLASRVGNSVKPSSFDSEFEEF
jgi:hypothetical protein